MKRVMASSIIPSAQPPEIILCITDNLPLSSVSCLALTNKSLGNLLGHSAWGALKSACLEQKIEFLSLLSRDLPYHYACLHGCIKLHLSKKIIWPNKLNGNEKGYICEKFSRGRFIARSHSPYEISATHVQLALKSHLYGAPHGIPLEAFTYTEVEQMPQSIFTELLSVDCRIASGELLLRSQHWVTVPTDQLNDIILRNVFNFQCKHMGGVGYEDQRARLMVQSIITNLNRGKLIRNYNTWVAQCSDCRMEFQIDSQALGFCKTAVFITRWANLGSGTVPFQSGAKFEGATEGHFIPGSLCEAFAAQSGLSLVEFTGQNRLRLLQERQRGSRTTFGWTRNAEKTQWYFQHFRERNEPTSIIGTAIRRASDWMRGIF